MAELVGDHLVARLRGLGAVTITEPGEPGPAWDRALSADGPVVLDVHRDPEIVTSVRK